MRPHKDNALVWSWRALAKGGHEKKKKKVSLASLSCEKRLRLPAGHTDFGMTKGAVGGNFTE
jgi:hypothetical protein